MYSVCNGVYCVENYSSDRYRRYHQCYSDINISCCTVRLKDEPLTNRDVLFLRASLTGLVVTADKRSN